jgi:hypothetical protein
MASQSISLRIPREMRADIEAISRRTRRDFSSVAKEMLAEAIKMRRIPGIIFGDSPSGRVAKVAGTGLGVFEIARDWRGMDGDWERLRQAFHWLSEHELRAAVAYAEAYPEEIDERLRADEYWTPERVWETYPFMRPRAR